MINPNAIIDYNRTDAELEELILFLVCVAGKKASTVAKQLDLFLASAWNPFKVIKFLINQEKKYPEYNHVMGRLRMYGFGQYNKLDRAFRELATSNINLRTCTLEDLMKIHGIGRKSASCFLAWTRKGVKVAMLDTHLLKYLRHVQNTGDYKLSGKIMEEPALTYWLGGFGEVNIPKSTPSSKKLYDKLESFYLNLCLMAKKNPTEFDLEIWRRYANKGETA